MIRVLRILLGILLAASSFSDIRSRYIYSEPFWIFIVLCAVLRFSQFPPVQTAVFLLEGALPGAAAFIWSRASGKIGEGDAWCILAAGVCCGLGETFVICIFALLAVCIVFLPYAVMRRKTPVLSVPFVPFLFAAYLLICVGGSLYGN